MYFNHFTVDDGLSQNTVFSITQDKFNSMWFATYDGLNKYDGYNFIVYKHDTNDSTTISDNILNVLYTDSNGNVWIGTHSGLSFYDRESDNFINSYKIIEGSKVQVCSILELNKDSLLIGTNRGLYLFNVESKKFSKKNFLLDDNISVNCLIKLDHLIYIGTDNNVYVCDILTSQIRKLSQNLDNIKIHFIVKSRKDNGLWIATEGLGLYYFDLDTFSTRHYTISDNLNSLYIRSLCYDSQDRLWIGTFNGLNIYDEETHTMSSFSHDPVDRKSLSQNSIRSIFLDSQGGMWLGTYFGGCNYYHPLKNQFRHIQTTPLKNSLSDNVVSCIVEDKNKNLWIGTNDYGLNFFDSQKMLFTHFDLKKNNKDIGSNNIKAVFVDECRKNIYIGTHSGGFVILNPQTRQIERYLPSNSNLSSENVYSILPENNEELWLGTLNGLVKFNIETKTFFPILEDKCGYKLQEKHITCLYKDTKDRLWIGGDNSLSVYIINNGDLFKKIQIFPYEIANSFKFVNCIIEDSRNFIWIGTRNGLFLYNEKDGKIQHYTEKNGLPNDVIYGILEDNLGRMWLSTNNGLCCFSLRDNTFRNFTVLDGLPSNQFNMYSFCKTSTGKMLFGGIKGIVEFCPEKLIDNPHAPKAELSELYLFNKRVCPNDQTGVLKKHISVTDEIELKPNQSSFSIEFVVSNYVSGQRNIFAYKLENYDKEWIYTSDQRVVSYSNLPAGKYVFRVKAANNAAVWNDETRNLTIIILPVWYKTWWAKVLFALLSSLLILVVLYIYKIRLSMKNELEMQRIERKNIEKSNEDKIRFFIDISHEIRTPLTLILSPLQEIMQRTNEPWLRDRLNIIHKNTSRLMYLVNQLLDFRKIEVGVFKLKVTEGNAHRLINECFLFFKDLAKSKEITYSFYSEIEDKTLIYDPNYLELIINNLLSNAFKFTSVGGIITISAKMMEDRLVVQVSDSGIGIPLEKQQQIFERFYSLNNNARGSGIGLSLVKMLVERHHGDIKLKSEVGKGTDFIVSIPQSRLVYKDDEFLIRQMEGDSFYYSDFGDEFVLHFEDQTIEKEMISNEDNLNKKSGHIVIVDDDEEILKYLKDGLADLYIVETANNVEDALRIVRTNISNIDLIITDIIMHGTSGLELCKMIKKNITTCHIPVIVVSSKFEIEDQIEGFDFGADDYITKPFSLLILRAKIQNILRTRRNAREYYSNSLDFDSSVIAFNRADEELLTKAKKIVEENIDNVEFTVDHFANAMNMSRSNLHLKLKAITGESALNFIDKIRFQKACRLLEDGRYSISEISTMVGFNSASYFTTRFKKYFNCSPSEYIKKQTK